MARTKVPTPVKLKSWDEVDTALQLIAECESCIDELNVELNRKIAEAKEEMADKAKAYQEKINATGVDIKEFVTANRDEIQGKTKQLNFGQTGFRSSTSCVVPAAKSADIIANLKRLEMHDCINTKETVNKEVLRRYPSDEILKTGAYLKTTDEFWYETKKEVIEDVAE